MKFLEAYMKYSEPSEIPEIFTTWGGLFLLAAALQRRAYTTLSRTESSYDIIIPSLYLGFIGTPASGKSFAKDRAREIFREVFPTYTIGPSRQSKEAIVKCLSNEDCELSYIDPDGERRIMRSLTFFINEFKNWLGIDPIGMIDFLTDIYGEAFYSSDTIKHSMEPVPYPTINLLACETPDWFRDSFKSKVLSGGFARRFICICHHQNRTHKAEQSLTEVELRAKAYCIAHLRQVEQLCGRFTWDADAFQLYAQWYENLDNFKSTNDLMAQFLSSKNIQVIKVAMLLAVNESPPRLRITALDIASAIILLNKIEPPMNDLFSGVGRNELSGVMHKIMRLLETAGGKMPDKQMLASVTNDVNFAEYIGIKRQLEHLGRIKSFRGIVAPDTVEREWLFLPTTFDKHKPKT